MTAVTYKRSGYTGIVTLSQPEKRNSMNPELLDEFGKKITEVKNDKDVRCLVITGTGSCFSAGANLAGPLQRGEQTKTAGERSFEMYKPFLKVLDLEVPVIGALNGHAVGGGFGLALLCDIRIANKESKYGANFARLGIHSGMAISYLLPRLVGFSRASQMLYTGELLLGEQAEKIGLVSECTDPADVLPRALEVAEQICASAPLAVRSMKQALREGLTWDPVPWAKREAKLQAVSLETDDAREGVSALLEKRAPSFTGK